MPQQKPKIATVEELATALYTACLDIQLLISQGKRGEEDLCKPTRTIFEPISEAMTRLNAEHDGPINQAYETLVAHTMAYANGDGPDRELEVRYRSTFCKFTSTYNILEHALVSTTGDKNKNT